MRTTKIITLASVLFAMAGQAAAQREILVSSVDRTLISFIPETHFAAFDWSNPETVDLSGLPIKESEATKLRAIVAEQSKEPTKVEPCDRSGLTSGSEFFGKPVFSDHLEDVVRSSEVAFVGQVSRRSVGLVPSTWRPNTRVYLKIEEVLYDPSGHLAPNQEWSYMIPYGTIRLGKAVLCHEPPAERYVAQPGDQVVFAGGFDRLNSQELNLYKRVVFEVKGGVILPDLNEFLTNMTPIPVSELRGQLHPQPKGKE